MARHAPPAPWNNRNIGKQALRYVFLKLALWFHTLSGFAFAFSHI